ncbi:MAG: acyl-CoA thioesterase II [Rhodospirillales bacterium]|nr:acyl-CoA thioesterase II [Rhodospirillales bacterium]MCW8861116.1 acyl-CoA thioesterase II [Rhodospirillales bacterium]MCW8951690.1 acyl-CoA thioesterase II [Rhodospirillales bacterium]MCW8970215.1 acyl-CoA thioesterase II [Rhodospirillales bacterium]MCW9003148.1 acyl-CoA thioesterase II [Rhodospirillales bacterium]
MGNVLKALLDLLDLERLEENLFRGQSPQDSWQRVFGGQVIGQALVAASRTVEGREPHSLHAYFLRPGDPSVPIIYDVDRIRDGRSFATRRVVAIQHGRAIFTMAVSFQEAEVGMEHQDGLPDVAAPETLPSARDRRLAIADRIPGKFREWFVRERPIEVRPVDPLDLLDPKPAPPRQHVWMKAVADMPDDPVLHKCVLAYASDMSFLETCLAPHGVSWFSDDIQIASLDHAMWFHRPFRMDDWLLYDQDSPSSSAGRGLNRGNVFTRDGKLIASVAQEALIRKRG